MKRCALLTLPARLAMQHSAVRADLVARGLVHPEPKTKSQKAENRGVDASRLPVQNPNAGDSNHGIPQV